MSIELFGASVRGPAHIRDGLPNQDAWGHSRVGDLRVGLRHIRQLRVWQPRVWPLRTWQLRI